MPSHPVCRVTIVDSKGRRVHVSVAECKDIALRSRRDHLERVAENDAIMATSTPTTNVQLNTLMVGIRRLSNKFATCHTRGVWPSTARSIS